MVSTTSFTITSIVVIVVVVGIITIIIVVVVLIIVAIIVIVIAVIRVVTIIVITAATRVVIIIVAIGPAVVAARFPVTFAGENPEGILISKVNEFLDLLFAKVQRAFDDISQRLAGDYLHYAHAFFGEAAGVRSFSSKLLDGFQIHHKDRVDVGPGEEGSDGSVSSSHQLEAAVNILKLLSHFRTVEDDILWKGHAVECDGDC